MRDPLFRDDLMVLATDGLPLWDGMADIQVRPALPEEEARWHASRAKAIRHGNIEREDDNLDRFPGRTHRSRPPKRMIEPQPRRANLAPLRAAAVASAARRPAE